MKKIMYLCLFFCLPLYAIAQSEEIDSLKKALNNYTLSHPNYQKDTVYIKQLLRLSMSYRLVNDEVATNKTAFEAIKLSENIQYPFGQGFGWLILAHFQGVKGDYKKTREYAQNAVPHLAKTTHLVRWHYARYLVASSLTNQGLFREALAELLILKDWQESIFKKIPKNENYYLTYYMLFRVYDNLKDQQRLEDCTNFILNHAPKNFVVYSNALGSRIQDLVDSKQYEKALAYHRELIQIYEKDALHPLLASGYLDMGHTFKTMKDIENAKNAYLNAIKNAKYAQRLNQANLALHATARIYMEQDSLPKALQCIQEAYELSEKLSYKEAQMVDAGLFAEICAKAKDFERAYNYHNKHKALSDELKAETNNKEIGRIEAKYEFAQKEGDFLRKQEIQKLQNERLEQDILLETTEKEKQTLLASQTTQKNKLLEIENEQKNAKIAEQKRVQAQQNKLFEAENAQQRLWISLSLVALVGLFVILLLILRNNRQKKQANQALILKNQEILQQKEEIQTQAEQLENANRTKDKLFAMVAHDLRSPLIAFQGISRLLNFHLKRNETEKIKELGNRIDKSTHNLYNFLDNLLNWAIIQQGEFRFFPENISCYEIIEEEIETFLPTAKSYGITLAHEVLPTTEVRADRVMLQAIVHNFISNALKFTPEAGKITLSIESLPTEFHLHCQDTGVGITPEKIANLFKVEVRKNSTGIRGEKGNGIGLPLCQEFAELHTGKITLTSEVGKGTRATLALPKLQEEN